jgi:hypothetical protein
MQLKFIGLSLLLSMFMCIGAIVPSVQADAAKNIRDGYEAQTQLSASHRIKPIVVAGSPEVCKANYDQCMRGCAGAQSCSNQCMTNYNGCLH